MNLSVIIPCYNKANTIKHIVQPVIDVIGKDDWYQKPKHNFCITIRTAQTIAHTILKDKK